MSGRLENEGGRGRLRTRAGSWRNLPNRFESESSVGGVKLLTSSSHRLYSWTNMATGNRVVQFLGDCSDAVLPRSRGIVLKAQLRVSVLSCSPSGLRIAIETLVKGRKTARWQKNAANSNRVVLALPHLSRLADLDITIRFGSKLGHDSK